MAASSSSLKIDESTALEMVKKGATLLLLNVPQFTLFGIDTQIFSVGPNFKGLKMVPPGTHFIYYSASNKEGNDFSPTVGFFITTNPAEVIIRKWNPEEERLVKISEEEEASFSEAVKNFEFDNQLGPYPLNHYGEWKQLSNYIAEDIIAKNEPIGGEISIAHESWLIDKVPITTMEKQLAEQLEDSKFSKPVSEITKKRRCYYSSIPHIVKERRLSGEDLTSMNLDKSRLLETILMKEYKGEEDRLLGELQFSFIAFMMGQSLEAFLQWKALVNLLFSCIEAPLKTRSQLFLKVIRVVYSQLKYGLHKENMNKESMDKGFSLFLDDEWFTKDTFLFRLCKDFFPVVLEVQGVDGDLLLWTRKLKRLLETTLGWEFDDSLADEMNEDDEMVCLFCSLLLLLCFQMKQYPAKIARLGSSFCTPNVSNLKCLSVYLKVFCVFLKRT